MRAEVARDLSDSAHDFLRVVWPKIKGLCQGGQLHPVESVVAKDFERQLDILAGIDAWQVVDGIGIRGIASRIQWIPDKGFWPTFTIRKSRSSGATTEWDKRIAAISDSTHGFIRPALIVHAYVQKPRRAGELNYVCMVRADDLFQLATDDRRSDLDLVQYGDFEPDKNKAWYEKKNPQDGNTFAVFPVKNLIANGVEVKTWARAADEFAA